MSTAVGNRRTDNGPSTNVDWARGGGVGGGTALDMVISSRKSRNIAVVTGSG